MWGISCPECVYDRVLSGTFFISSAIPWALCVCVFNGPNRLKWSNRRDIFVTLLLSYHIILFHIYIYIYIYIYPRIAGLFVHTCKWWWWWRCVCMCVCVCVCVGGGGGGGGNTLWPEGHILVCILHFTHILLSSPLSKLNLLIWRHCAFNRWRYCIIGPGNY